MFYVSEQLHTRKIRIEVSFYSEIDLKNDYNGQSHFSACELRLLKHKSTCSLPLLVPKSTGFCIMNKMRYWIRDNEIPTKLYTR